MEVKVERLEEKVEVEVKRSEEKVKVDMERVDGEFGDMKKVLMVHNGLRG